MLRTLASKTVLVLSTAVAATAFAASVSAQTIIVDGVTYQAVPSTGYAVPAPVPAPLPVAPVFLPVARAYPVPQPVQQPVYQPAAMQPQVTVSTADVVAPLVFAAFGLWALNDWFNGDNRGHQRRAHVSQPRPVQPAYPGYPAYPGHSRH